jgi:DNA-binding transcriptional regulator YbjK
MSMETFRDTTRQILENLLNETAKADRVELIEVYTEALTKLYAAESHQLLTEVIEDVRTRLDARLSPDPVRQTIAGVQTTIQDIWNGLWK